MKAASVGARAGVDLLNRSASDAAAQKTAEALGQLRGLATKVGQMASYVDGIVPPSKSEAYEKWMKTLRSQAPQSSWSDIRESLKAELGEYPEHLFSEFDESPVASASIGQVYRATTRSGQAVAVKVQHPGISEAMENDLRSAGFIESTLAKFAGMRKFNSKHILEEMRQRFREELDYGLEAQRQEEFRRLFHEVPEVHIPKVFSEYCSSRVLTTAWAQGRSFDEVCQMAPTQRIAWAETLWHFVYRANLLGGRFNADPHPGNYIFHDDGHITFLDFGCIQPIEAHRTVSARQMHWAARHQNDSLFRDAARILLELRGGRYEERALDYVSACFRPLSESPFHLTRSYVVELVDKMKAMIAEFRTSKDDGYTPLPDGLFFVNRLQFGFYSVLARLDVPVDYGAVEGRFLTDDQVDLSSLD